MKASNALLDLIITTLDESAGDGDEGGLISLVEFILKNEAEDTNIQSAAEDLRRRGPIVVAQEVSTYLKKFIEIALHEALMEEKSSKQASTIDISDLED